MFEVFDLDIGGLGLLLGILNVRQSPRSVIAPFEILKMARGDV